MASNNSEILDSLPPIVPSIGWRKPQKIDVGGQHAINEATTSSHPNVQPESSQITSAADENSGNNDTNASPIRNIPSTVKIGNRTVITSKPPRQWAWKSFTSSARHDSANFFHWVRANVEYADYPYARFDVHLDPLTYTDEEYQKHLAMSEVEDLGDTLPDFLAVANQIKVEGEGKETKTKADTTAEESSFQHQLLQSNKILPWTKTETDVLMELCQKYDLRWPVIIDRWHLRFKTGSVSSLRKVEDLQHRYYQVGSILAQKRVVEEITKLSEASTTPGTDVPAVKDTTVDAPTTGEATNDQPTAPTAQKPLHETGTTEVESTLKPPSATPAISFPNTGTSSRGKVFDLVTERARRKQLEYVWNQSREEAQEEAALRAELRAVEAQLRKLKKTGKHLVPSRPATAAVPPPIVKKQNTSSTGSAAPASSRPTAVVSAAAPVDPFSNAHQEVDASFKETAPVPTPGTPYLQSGRLFPPNIEGHSRLKKSTLKQMDEILSELGVPKEPIATKRSCDLFDGVRKDAMALLILQKMALKKEAELADKKAKLEKRTVKASADTTEEKAADSAAAKDTKPAVKTEEATGTAATSEKVSKKKRKTPTPSTTTAAAAAGSQPTLTTSSSDAKQPAAPTTSSNPTTTSAAPVTVHAVTSSSTTSQGKTTKAAPKTRVRKK